MRGRCEAVHFRHARIQASHNERSQIEQLQGLARAIHQVHVHLGNLLADEGLVHVGQHGGGLADEGVVQLGEDSCQRKPLVHDVGDDRAQRIEGVVAHGQPQVVQHVARHLSADVDHRLGRDGRLAAAQLVRRLQKRDRLAHVAVGGGQDRL